MTTSSGSHRGRRVWLLRIGLIAGVLLIANLPVTTKQGVNYEVSEHRLPLYLKTFEFLDLDAQYRQLAREIIGDAPSDRARIMGLFGWTARRISAKPQEAIP